MDENIKIIFIHGNNILGTKNRNGSMDIMFYADYQTDAVSFSIETFNIGIDAIIDKVNSVNQNMLKNKEQLVGKEELYHIDYVKYYLKENFHEVFNNFFLSQFNPNNQMALFSILADAGNVVLLNSDYFTLGFIPKSLSQEQKKFLMDLEQVFIEQKQCEFQIINSVKNKNKNITLVKENYKNIIDELIRQENIIQKNR